MKRNKFKFFFQKCFYTLRFSRIRVRSCFFLITMNYEQEFIIVFADVFDSNINYRFQYAWNKKERWHQIG